MNIVGISAYYHDSAACLLRDGEIIAAAQEERSFADFLESVLNAERAARTERVRQALLKLQDHNGFILSWAAFAPADLDVF